MGAWRLRSDSRSSRRFLPSDRPTCLARRQGARLKYYRRHRHQPLRAFRFKTLGLLASIGQRTGVARILGINFSGFAAWWIRRTIYLSKLPRIEKKVRVALDWTLDLFFSKDFVQYAHDRSRTISTEHEHARDTAVALCVSRGPEARR